VDVQESFKRNNLFRAKIKVLFKWTLECSFLSKRVELNNGLSNKKTLCWLTKNNNAEKKSTEISALISMVVAVSCRRHLLLFAKKHEKYLSWSETPMATL
jgi:hypothetical protein